MGITMFFIQKMSPSTSDRPYAAEDHDLYAGYVYFLLPMVPIWSSSILASIKHRNANSANSDLSFTREERLTL